ncbi:unnamed protein product [Lampetra fluviatilis]
MSSRDTAERLTAASACAAVRPRGPELSSLELPARHRCPRCRESLEPGPAAAVASPSSRRVAGPETAAAMCSETLPLPGGDAESLMDPASFPRHGQNKHVSINEHFPALPRYNNHGYPGA